MGYSCFILKQSSRDLILSKFPPKYDRVIAHHITVKFGIPSDAMPPKQPKKVEVVGYSTDGDIECLVVSVDGSLTREDGKLFHITLSLNPLTRKPVDSNKILEARGYSKVTPFKIEVAPAISTS